MDDMTARLKWSQNVSTCDWWHKTQLIYVSRSAKLKNTSNTFFCHSMMLVEKFMIDTNLVGRLPIVDFS